MQFRNHKCFKAFAIWLVLLSFASSASAQVWTKTSAPNKSWYAVATSADGIKLAAAFQSSGGIYASSNSGATWFLTSAPAKSWTALASSADGSVLLAAAIFGGIYTSTNAGNTWRSNSIPGNAQWAAAAASADGNTLIVSGSTGGLVYFSTNTGANWRSNGIPGYWTSVVCSADGTKLAAAWNGTIYVSTNNGYTWANYYTELGTVLACSADGKQLILMKPNANVSTNWGLTWSTLSVLNKTVPFALSADAGRFVVCENGVIDVSTTIGGTWRVSYAPAKTWRSIALSADGTKMVAVTTSTSDGIYVWQPPILNFTNFAGNLVFYWPTNGTTFFLQTNSDLTTTNWKIVAAASVVSSNWQVTIMPTNSFVAYRLMSQ